MSSKISVVIPTYNSAKTLAVCLQSLADQTYRDFEVLIIDGVSKDNTISVANGFVDVIPNLFVLSEPDKGIYDAMNKGIGLAKGDWLYFLGSDDSLFDNQVFEKVSSQFKIEKLEVLYGDVISDRFLGVYGGKFDADRLSMSNISHQSLFYKKSLFARIGLYDIQYKLLADWDFNLKWFYSQIFAVHIDIVIARYSDGGQSSSMEDLNFEGEKWQLILDRERGQLSTERRNEIRYLYSLQLIKSRKILKSLSLYFLSGKLRSNDGLYFKLFVGLLLGRK